MTLSWILLFGLLFALLLTSTPIAVALGLTTFVYFFYFTTIPLTQVPGKLFTALDAFPLMAIPFFVLAANIMSRGGISKRLIAASNAMVGQLRGGLAMTAVIACVFFAAISGSSPATVVAVGSLLIPAMIASGYGKEFSTGVIATSGSLGILIPPSIPLIVYGITTEQSIGDLFIAGLLPGALAGGMLLLVVVWISRRRGLGPSPVARTGDPGADTQEVQEDVDAGGGTVVLTRREKVRALRDASLSLALPGLVLGGIYGGIFTPTEAAAAAVFYALVIALLVYREIGIADLKQILLKTVRTSSMIMFIIANGILFSFVLTSERIPKEISETLLDMDLSKWAFLLVVNVLLLIVGCFMETSSAIIILAPIILPIAVELGVHPVHLGIIMVMNLEIGMITPPLGLNLFVASGLSKMNVLAVARAALPTALVLLGALLVVTYVPDIALAFLDGG